MASKRLCHFGGNCKKRENCRFEHPADGDSAPSLSPKPTAKPQKICLFGDNCKRRPECRFAHPSEDANLQDRSEPNPSFPLPQVNYKEKCRYGLACKNQPKCTFDHTPSPELKSSAAVEKILADCEQQLRVSNRTKQFKLCFFEMFTVACSGAGARNTRTAPLAYQRFTTRIGGDHR